MRRALIIDDEEAVLKIITHFIEMKDMPIKIVDLVIFVLV